jgi:hypothetical protein
MAAMVCWHELVGCEVANAGQNHAVDNPVATAAVHEKRDFEIFTSKPVSDGNIQLVRKFQLAESAKNGNCQSEKCQDLSMKKSVRFEINFFDFLEKHATRHHATREFRKYQRQ